MSRIYDALRQAEAGRSRPGLPWDAEPRPFRVIAVASNKGGVGKTTVATNLAVYLRALREDLPVLVLGLDDQLDIDRMFALGPTSPRLNLAGALRQGRLDGALSLGQYGIHYVPGSRGLSELKREVEDPFALRALLWRSGWRGLVVIDTKSDLEILTQNALAAADRCLVLVKDRASLDEAERVFALLKRWERPEDCARVLLSLVDLRVKYAGGEDGDVLSLLVSEVRRRGFPLLETFLSRSPKVESLHTNPSGRTLSILHGAPGSLVHRQFAHLAEDVLRWLDQIGLAPPASSPQPRAEPTPLPPKRTSAKHWLLAPPRRR